MIWTSHVLGNHGPSHTPEKDHLRGSYKGGLFSHTGFWCTFFPLQWFAKQYNGFRWCAIGHGLGKNPWSKGFRWFLTGDKLEPLRLGLVQSNPSLRNSNALRRITDILCPACPPVWEDFSFCPPADRFMVNPCVAVRLFKIAWQTSKSSWLRGPSS